MSEFVGHCTSKGWDCSTSLPVMVGINRGYAVGSTDGKISSTRTNSGRNTLQGGALRTGSTNH